MYRGKTIIQIGSHIGNTNNDPIFDYVDHTTRMILVEPVPYLFEKLKCNYVNKLQDVSNITFVGKAVSDFVGFAEMTIPSEKNDFSVLPPWASQLASMRHDHASSEIPGIQTETITVPTTTLNNIVNDNGITHIDLLQTDTEGHDYNILSSYNFIVKPRKIIFEHKHMDGFFEIGEKYNKLVSKLVSVGYKLTYQTCEDTTFELL